MPTTVIAQDGDTLCGLAISGGFLNCQALRDDPANAAFLTRDLQAGDVVTVPDRESREESRGTEAEHLFEVQTAPPILVRFTHGTPDKPYRQDPTLLFLNVSNFVSNKGGANGRQAFPTATVFDANGHADPDSFKIEVVDPAGPATVRVRVEAMRPILAPDGTITGHEPFTGDAADLRFILSTCRKVPSGVCYRSPYLRLVTTEQDLTNNPNGLQMVFVTDQADGTNGDNDKIEILDQKVRVSYTRESCPAANPNKCTARSLIEIGPRRRRIRMAVHVFRQAVGGANVGNITETMVRLRVFKWFRRVYAQAELAPKLDPGVDFLDPPANDMLIISPNHGRASVGGSTLSFTLSQMPPAAPSASDPNVSVPLTAGLNPRAIGDLVVTAVNALPGFSAQPFTNPRAFDAPFGSCDVVISRADGGRVRIINETTTDTGLTAANGVRVARVNIANIETADTFAARIASHEEYRRILRVSPGTGDRMQVYVIGGFVSPTLLGRAIVWGRDVAADFQGQAPLKYCALLKAMHGANGVMDGSDDFPQVLAHESMHTLADVFHVGASEANRLTELMFNNAPLNDAVDAARRICDAPLLLKYETFTAAQATPGAFNLNTTLSLVDRIRDRGDPTMEDW